MSILTIVFFFVSKTVVLQQDVLTASLLMIAQAYNSFTDITVTPCLLQKSQ
jgi:hypothetical protein